MEAPGHLDDDGDLIGNRCDNCPTVANPDQKDTNQNGWGDTCDVDLSIQAVDAVQSVYDVPLVRGKGTAFRVQVRSTASYPVKTSFRLMLPATEWDMVRGNAMDKSIVPAGYKFPEIWGPVEIPAHADHYVVMLPVINETERDKEIDLSAQQIAGRLIKPDQDNWLYGDVLPDVRVVPKPIGNTASFTVIIDPDNVVPEADENNNRMSSFPYSVFTTRGYSFGIQRLNVVSKGWDPAWDNDPAANPQNCRKTCGPGDQGQARTVIKHNLEYLLAVFPVADDKVYARFLPGEETWDTENEPYNDDRGAYLTHLYSKVAGIYDWGVGLTCGCCGGTMLWDTKAVLIGNSSGNIQNLAHEASHVTVVAGSSDCYGCGEPTNDARCSDCVSSPGFWVNRWREYPRGSAPAGWSPADAATWTTGSADWLRKCSYMDFADYAPYCWARKDAIGRDSGGFFDDGYLNLISNLADPNDPKGILVKGALLKNGTASFDSFTILPATHLDIEPGTKGEYHLLLLDAAGTVLSDTGFNVTFFATADPPRSGAVPVDRMAFASIFGWKNGTQQIELRNAAGQVLAVRKVSPHPPVVHILFPQGGERWKAGELRTVRWEASDADGDPLTAAVLVSSDGGSTWVPAGSDLSGSAFTFDTTGLAGSENARIKVRVSDGVNTAEAVSDAGFTIIGESPSTMATTKAAGGMATGILACTAVLMASLLFLIDPRKRTR
ncbi:MAG: thrombospondin type 3 repeat-containing protein [Methanoregula sp.]